MNWETVNPQWWVPRGYAAVRVDGRGSGKSPGQCEPWSLAEAIDFYDAIEWAAAQPWCNGKVGLSGISYFAINQWFVANLQPPSLKAIIPWEGFADLYRDALFHGGLLSLFMPNWFVAHLMHHVVGRASRHHPNAWQSNTLHFWLSNSLDSGALGAGAVGQDHGPDVLGRQLVGMALHLRGNTEAFMRAASKHKKLRIRRHPRAPVLHRGRRRDQLRFFDYWLKGIDNGVMDEPPVKLAIRKGRDQIEWRHEHEWPLAAPMDQALFRSVGARARQAENAGGLVSTNPRHGRLAHLSGDQPGLDGLDLGSLLAGDGRRHPPAWAWRSRRRRCRRTSRSPGPVAAVLWVASSTEDMDLFLTIRNIDADGNEVLETGQQGTPVPVAKGWLRVSHRELDPALSLPYRPYHASAPALSHARRDRRGRGRDLADLDGVQGGPPHPARHPAARRRRQRLLHALPRRLQ